MAGKKRDNTHGHRITDEMRKKQDVSPRWIGVFVIHPCHRVPHVRHKHAPADGSSTYKEREAKTKAKARARMTAKGGRAQTKSVQRGGGGELKQENGGGPKEDGSTRGKTLSDGVRRSVNTRCQNMQAVQTDTISSMLSYMRPYPLHNIPRQLFNDKK